MVWEISLEVALVIICGSIPTVKPIFDHFHKGTPLRPAGVNYRNKNSYKLHSITKGSSKMKFMGRSANFTNVTSTIALEGRSPFETNASPNLRGIHIERGIDVDHYKSASSRDQESRETNVV